MRPAHVTSLAIFSLVALLPSACRQTKTPAQVAAGPQDVATGYVRYSSNDYSERQAGRPGGTLRISTATDTAILDPHGTSATYIQWFGRLVFDNLVYLDPDGVAEPWLAVSWTISPDGKVYTFHLRQDVTFSDGSRFDAEAVRLNLEHMRDPATRSPLAARYIAPYAEGRVIDAFTFEARLSQPYTPFLNVLAQSWLAMISPKQIRENPRAAVFAPIGSGPFVLESYTRNKGLRLARRPDYHWAPALLRHEGPGYLDRLEVDIIPEAMIRYSGLASGEYDLTLEAPPQNAAAIRSDPELVFDGRIRQGNPLRGLAFNTEKPPFDDVRVRRAVALSIDREGIAQIVGFGEYRPKADFLAATTRYYDPAYSQVLHYDPAEANRLLDEAGWTGRDPEGFRTKNGQRLNAQFLTSDLGTSTAVGVAMQADAKKIGFDLHLVQLPQNQLADHRTAGTYQAIAAGVWHTNTPDALYVIYHSDEIPSPAHLGQNTSRLRDTIFDDLVGRARQSSDSTVLQDLYSRAQRRLTELVPAVPLYENYSLVAYRKRLHGVIYDTSHNTPMLIGAWLEEGGP